MTEDTFNPDDSLFTDLFAEAGWDDVAKAAPNERRVEEITQRAMAETIVKESSAFFFVGFSTALSEFFATLFGRSNESDEDYKP